MKRLSNCFGYSLTRRCLQCRIPLRTLMDAREFLTEALSILATSTDFPATIDKLARLANSSFSDWCAIYAFENTSRLRRLFPSEGLYPLDFNAPSGPGY